MKKLFLVFLLFGAASLLPAQNHFAIGTNLGAVLLGGFEVHGEYLFNSWGIGAGLGATSLTVLGTTLKMTVTSFTGHYYFDEIKGFYVGLSLGSASVSSGAISVSLGANSVLAGYRFLLSQDSISKNGFVLDLGGGLVFLNYFGSSISQPSLGLALGWLF